MSENSKILFLVQLPPPIHGASLRNLSLVKSALLNQCFEVDLMPLKFAKSIEDIERVTLTKLMKMVLFAIRLTAKLIINRPNLVYFTIAPVGVAFYRDVLYTAIIKTMGVKIVYHLRGLGIEDSSKGRMNKWLYKFSFRNTSVICLSKLAAKDIKGVYDDIPIVVNNGIEDPITKYNLRLNARPVSKVVKILFLSNLIVTKGVIILVEALSVLDKEGVNFSATIVGEESSEISKDELEQLILDKGLEKKVFVKGPVYDLEKFKLFLKNDLFVFPTYRENFPGVVLEAMACGLPIITTDVGSIPEIIDNMENGIIVPNKSIKLLADKIKFLVKNRALSEEIGVKARTKFEQKYMLEAFEKNMVKTLKDCIN